MEIGIQCQNYIYTTVYDLTTIWRRCAERDDHATANH